MIGKYLCIISIFAVVTSFQNIFTQRIKYSNVVSLQEKARYINMKNNGWLSMVADSEIAVVDAPISSSENNKKITKKYDKFDKAKRPNTSKSTDEDALKAFNTIPSNKWMNGIVQSVSSFGIFVRPAGFEITGNTSSILIFYLFQK